MLSRGEGVRRSESPNASRRPRVRARQRPHRPSRAIPASAAQEVCDKVVAAGVTSILNFAPVVLAVPPHVDLRKVDLAAELQILSFHETRKALAKVSVR